MYDFEALKPRIVATQTEVECPVANCTVRVPRPDTRLQREDRFRCPLHGIYLTPRTFAYDDPCANLLWSDPGDLAVLDRLPDRMIRRMAAEGSSEALTWNVFRWLERSGRRAGWLAGLDPPGLGDADGEPEAVYWGYAPQRQGTWPELAGARREFSGGLHSGPLPAVIAANRRLLVWIETGLADGQPSGCDGAAESPFDSLLHPAHHWPEKLRSGGQGWLYQAFAIPPEDGGMSEAEERLARFWLVGSWLAAQTGRDFCLALIDREAAGWEIARRFTARLFQNSGRRFRSLTWEGLYHWVAAGPAGEPDDDRRRLLEYLRNKTLGYGEDGRLRPAFCV